MFQYASAFNQDISSWTGSAATSAQTDMFLDASAFQAKFACTDAVTGPASSCEGPSPIPAGTSWHTFVKDCLDESAAIGETGECIDWAQSQNVWYGTMPNWDTSLVTDMSGWDYTADFHARRNEHENLRARRSSRRHFRHVRIFVRQHGFNRSFLGRRIRQS